jgi:methionyl-tRNA synthetase
MPNWTEYYEPSFDNWKGEVNELLTQYIQELDAVKLRAGLFTVLLISQQGNSFLQLNKLNNLLHEDDPSKCEAVIGLAINLVHLLASIIAPFMPETARSINTQLRADPLPILDHWNADSIQPSHEIGNAEHLFSRIPPEKAQEWRAMFGSEEAKKLKEEEALMKARKYVAKKVARTPKPDSTG